MEPISSLPCSQGPTTGPYPEPDESSPHPHNLFQIRLNITLNVTLNLSSEISTHGTSEKPYQNP